MKNIITIEYNAKFIFIFSSQVNAISKCTFSEVIYGFLQKEVEENFPSTSSEWENDFIC